MGVEHILLSVDHLPFVLGLLLIVRDRRMLVKTISRSRGARHHAGVDTLGYASPPLLAPNAAIALLILFLGPEIVRARRGQSSFTIVGSRRVAMEQQCSS